MNSLFPHQWPLQEKIKKNTASIYGLPSRWISIPESIWTSTSPETSGIRAATATSPAVACRKCLGKVIHKWKFSWENHSINGGFNGNVMYKWRVECESHLHMEVLIGKSSINGGLRNGGFNGKPWATNWGELILFLCKPWLVDKNACMKCICVWIREYKAPLGKINITSWPSGFHDHCSASGPSKFVHPASYMRSTRGIHLNMRFT